MALPPDKRIELEDRLNKIIPRITDSPVQAGTLIDNLIKQYGVHQSELRFRIEEGRTLTDFDRQIQQMRRRLALIKQLDSVCTWDNFVRACAAKVDLQTNWRPKIMEALGVDGITLRVREDVGYVPCEWFDKVTAMPDLDPHVYIPRSNYADVCEPLESTLRAAGRAPHWIAKTLTEFLARFNGVQVTVADVRFTKPQPKEK